jgi:hypothetical protein
MQTKKMGTKQKEHAYISEDGLQLLVLLCTSVISITNIGSRNHPLYMRASLREVLPISSASDSIDLIVRIQKQLNEELLVLLYIRYYNIRIKLMLPSSGIYRRAVLMLTDVSEERITS